jgi:probable HAF family extracellular repeat protein
MKKRILLITLLGSSLLSFTSASTAYDVIDLGTLGGNSSSASSINNSGQIVGWSKDSSGYERATLFDSTGDGNNIDLGALVGNNSHAESINDNGQIVGSAYKSPGFGVATMFDPTGNGNNIDLGTLPGGNWSVAESINNNGQIVGEADNAALLMRPTLFDPTGDGNNIDLGTLPGCSSGAAVSINNNGQIVGACDNIILTVLRATLFDPTGNGNNIDLDVIDDRHSIAWSINDKGEVAGEAHTTNLDFLQAILFDSTGDGNNINLGVLPNFDKSYALSINNKGQIVGVCDNATLTFARATLFDPTGNGNNINLNELIDPNLGWVLISANGINDNGWIVGYGLNPDGYTRAFLLKPINTAPVAIAGPNQVVYVCSDDELADVTLDGSASYDDDNDILDYYWSWYIDSNLYEANGVSPTIQLPVGTYEIELIVDDGTDESKPNYCTVTVVEPLHAKMLCIPSFINTQSRRGIITAFVYMPDGVEPNDIDSNEPLLFICDRNAVESTRQFVSKWNMHGRSHTWVIASFDKGDCIDIMSPGNNRIKVAGRLNSDRCYYANSSIYVYKPKPFRRWWKFPK